MLVFAVLLVVFSFFFSSFFSGRAFACTTVLVGKSASETGEVLVGHNEDSGGRYWMRTHLVPASTRPSGGTVRFEPHAAELPLPRERARLFWSEARPYIADGGASFCDLYINGNGVVLCSDNCGKPREDAPELTEGGIGYGVRRLVAEQAKSAYHAVEVAADLVGRYGYTGNGRSYHFADKNEIWVFQVVNGKKWAVKRVPDDQVYLNPNHYTIRTPDAGTPGLEDLVAYAARRGWHDPEKPFDFARSYQAPEGYRAEHNLHRHHRGLELILGRPMPDADLPFSVEPGRKIGVGDVKKVLRCHFEGTSDDVSSGGSPHNMKTRPICVSSTLESTVVQIRENHAMTLIRRALGRPCLAPYIPWYFGMDAVPEGFCGNDPEEALKTHFSVAPSDLDYTQGKAWFLHTDLQAALDPQYGSKAAEVKEALAALEETFENELRGFEPLAEAHFRTDAAKARALLTGSVADWAKRALSKLEALYASVAPLPVEAPAVIDVNDGGTFTVAVPLEKLRTPGREPVDCGDLDLEKTLFGPHYASPAKRSQAQGAAVEGDRLLVSFAMGEWARNSTPCLTDLWLTLRDTQGRSVVGKALSTLTPERAHCGKETPT